MNESFSQKVRLTMNSIRIEPTRISLQDNPVN